MIHVYSRLMTFFHIWYFYILLPSLICCWWVDFWSHVVRIVFFCYLLMSPCLVLGIDYRLWLTRHGRCTRRGTTHSSWTCSRDSTSLSSPVPSVARWDQGIPTLPGDYLSCFGIYLLWEFPTHSRESLSSLGISTLSRNSPYRV